MKVAILLALVLCALLCALKAMPNSDTYWADNRAWGAATLSEDTDSAELLTAAQQENLDEVTTLLKEGEDLVVEQEDALSLSKVLDDEDDEPFEPVERSSTTPNLDRVGSVVRRLKSYDKGREAFYTLNAVLDSKDKIGALTAQITTKARGSRTTFYGLLDNLTAQIRNAVIQNPRAIAGPVNATHCFASCTGLKTMINGNLVDICTNCARPIILYQPQENQLCFALPGDYNNGRISPALFDQTKNKCGQANLGSCTCIQAEVQPPIGVALVSLAFLSQMGQTYNNYAKFEDLAIAALDSSWQNVQRANAQVTAHQGSIRFVMNQKRYQFIHAMAAYYNMQVLVYQQLVDACVGNAAPVTVPLSKQNELTAFLTRAKSEQRRFRIVLCQNSGIPSANGLRKIMCK